MLITSLADEPEQTVYLLEFRVAELDGAVRLAGLGADAPGSAPAVWNPCVDEDPFMETRRQVMVGYGRVLPNIRVGRRRMAGRLDELTLIGADPQTAADDLAKDPTQVVAASGVPYEDLGRR